MSEANGVTTIDELMAQCEDTAQEAYSTAEEFNDYMPPDGTYSVVFGSPTFKTYMDKKTEKPAGIVNLPHTIVGGAKVERNDFQKSFFLTNKVDAACLKGLTELLAGGDAPDQLRDALALVEKVAPGKAAQLKISRSPNKGNPERPYVNLKYLAVASPQATKA